MKNIRVFARITLKSFVFIIFSHNALFYHIVVTVKNVYFVGSSGFQTVSSFTKHINPMLCYVIDRDDQEKNNFIRSWLTRYHRDHSYDTFFSR